MDGQSLKDKWQDGPQTFLGVLVAGFPNMLMIVGPHTALGNIPRSIEYNVDWVTGLIRYAGDRGLTRVEATEAAVASWTDHVRSLGVGLLSNEVNSWMTGVNRNVDGKQTRIIARYSGSAPAYRARCDEVAADDYRPIARAKSVPRRHRRVFCRPMWARAVFPVCFDRKSTASRLLTHCGASLAWTYRLTFQTHNRGCVQGGRIELRAPKAPLLLCRSI